MVNRNLTVSSPL